MQQLTLKEKVGYGLGDTASNIVFQVVINFLVYFYTDIYGLTAAAVGTLMLSVRLFDAFTDPLMGGIADRTRSAWGRYRPYMLWLALPYGLLAVLAFTTPSFGDSGKLIYAYVTYVALMTIYTAINIPYSALGGVITADPQERASVQAWRFALAMLGGVLVAASVLPLVERLGGDSPQRGFQLAMAVLAVVAVICFVLCFLWTKERVEPDPTTTRQSIGKDFASLLANDQWRIIALITFVLLTSIAMKGGATPFFVKYFLGREDLVTLFITLGMLAGVAGALSANWLSSRFCKVAVMKWATIGTILFNAALLMVTPNALVAALVLSVLASYFHMILTPNLFAAVADTVDYGLKKWNQGAMAMSYSGHLLALKIGIAVGGALTGWGLAAVGYQANEQQTEQALTGIVWIYAGASAITGLIALLLLGFYRLRGDWLLQSELFQRK